jgi:AAA+ ATPase superfamily predicted ATPase
MQNPFKYGVIVTDEDFADRKKELKLLTEELANGQNILLYSYRRYGKSSLLAMVLELLKKRGLMTSMIDLYGCTSLSDFIDKLVEETVVPAYRTTDKIINFLKSNLSGLKTDVTINPDGSTTFSFKKEVESREPSDVLDRVLDAPEKLAEAKKKRVVIVFDEFQEIIKLNGKRLEDLMRTHFQRHKNVSYVFMGSKRHIMEQMFEDVKRPFYKFAKPIPLGKIPIQEFKEFILAKFEKGHIGIDPSIVDSILKLTNGHPYFTQQICHEVWNIVNGRKKVLENDVQEAIAVLLEIHNDLFERIWDSMYVPQRKLLIGLAKEDAVSAVYSTSFIKKYDLASASQVKRAIEPLLEDGTVEKEDDSYTIAEILFKEWIKA